MHKTIIFILTGLLMCGKMNGQNLNWDSLNKRRLELNRQHLYILGAWGAANVIQGSISASNSTGSTRYFHQMNAYWNLVNLGIAGYGYWQASQISLVVNFWEVLTAQQQIEKVLLFNSALDLAYMAIGFFLIEKGLRLKKERWIGFGKSILLQAAFLLLFDGILVGFQLDLGAELLECAKSLGSA